MKIKSIVTLCKKRNYAVLAMSENGTQWLGDGCALYPLYEAPIYDQTSLCAAYDITENQSDKIIFQTSDEKSIPLCIKDDDLTETAIGEYSVTVGYKGKDYAVFSTPDGALFLNRKYLTPFKDMDGAEIYLRYAESGQAYFAVKFGFMLYGVIMPDYIADEMLCENLKSLSTQCGYALSKKESKESD